MKDDDTSERPMQEARICSEFVKESSKSQMRRCAPAPSMQEAQRLVRIMKNARWSA